MKLSVRFLQPIWGSIPACLIRNPNVCVFFLHAAVGSGLLKKDEGMKTIKQTGLAVPSKRRSWGAVMQHRKTTEQVWGMTLTNSIFDLYSVFLIIVIFFRFIVVFQNVSALYKCSVCFSRKSQNKQAKKPKPKVQPQSWKLHIRSRNGQTLLAQISLSSPALCSEGRKQKKAVLLWHFLGCWDWKLSLGSLVEHWFMMRNQLLPKRLSLTRTSELYCKTEKLIKSLFIQLHALSLLYLDKQPE